MGAAKITGQDFCTYTFQLTHVICHWSVQLYLITRTFFNYLFLEGLQDMLELSQSATYLAVEQQLNCLKKVGC